jgi:AcrR family transcriptional regulator
MQIRNAERARKTRETLVEAARRLFAEHGYAATPTEAIIAAAGVTRGALYHHFADKAALFEAVCEEISIDARAAVEGAISLGMSSGAALKAGLAAWLAFVLEPGVCRILLLEGPTVLGWQRWNALDEKNSFQSLREGVEEAVAAGELRFAGGPELLATLLNGAVNALALRLAAEGAAPERATWAALRELIEAFEPR